MPYQTLQLHQQARAESYNAFLAEYGRAPNLGERQIVQVMGLHESSYGYGWRREGVGSNNMGAIQSAQRPPCDGVTAFQYGDTHADGSAYVWCYRKYPTREAGWRDLVRTAYRNRGREVVRAAAARGDWRGAITKLRETGYFELPLPLALRAYEGKLREMTTMLGEPMPNPKASSRLGTALKWAGLAAMGTGVVMALRDSYRTGRSWVE